MLRIGLNSMDKNDFAAKYRDWIIFGGILCFGIVLRILYFSWNGWNPNRDFVTYQKIIENLANHDRNSLSHVVIPPLYFMLTAAISRLGIPIVNAAVMISIFASAVLDATTFFLAQKLFNQKVVSFLLMLMVALIPEMVFIGCSPLRDSLGLSLNAVCFTFLLYGLCSGKMICFFAAGLCTGIGAMVRTENLEGCFLAVLCLMIMFYQRVKYRRAECAFPRILAAGILFGGSMAVAYLALCLYAGTFGYDWYPQLSRYWRL